MSHGKERSLYIWGTGYWARTVNTYCAGEMNKIGLRGYIDNAPDKWGKEFAGKKIYSPDILRQEKDCTIVIMTKYADEITRQIEREYPWLKENIEVSWRDFLEKMQLLVRYENCKEEEIAEVTAYLREHPLQVFNYAFTEKYRREETEICYDEAKMLYYVYYGGKKMYFSAAYDTEEKVREYYRSILLEQDAASPHRYLTEDFGMPEGAVVIDAGVAEGNFALSIIHRARKVYLFEPDAMWAEALEHTFAPYGEKVVIIRKALSNYTNGDTTTIDQALQGERVDFLKMDIEGEEYYALQGAESTIARSPGMKCVICTYHQEFAYEVIRHFLEQSGFATKASRGYMWYPDGSNMLRLPVLRKGVIRGEKREK